MKLNINSVGVVTCIICYLQHPYCACGVVIACISCGALPTLTAEILLLALDCVMQL